MPGFILALATGVGLAHCSYNLGHSQGFGDGFFFCMEKHSPIIKRWFALSLENTRLKKQLEVLSRYSMTVPLVTSGAN